MRRGLRHEVNGQHRPSTDNTAPLPVLVEMGNGGEVTPIPADFGSERVGRDTCVSFEG